jgi:hypothetical protein
VSSLIKNLALLALSLLVALVLAELALRAFVPRYEYAAGSVHERDAGRLIVRRPSSSYTRPHPDSGVRHPVIHNNLALRQHRDVPLEKPPGEVRIGVFGDSFTENPRVPAPYAFTEVLDYLLNTTRPGFNVLNFGVDGYATDQAWLYAQSAPAATSLDVVLYVFAANDVRGLYENDLLALGPDGAIVRKPPPPVAWWVPWLSRLHLTYLALDVRNRIQGASDAGEAYDPLEARILEEMRDARDRRTRDATSEAIAGDLKRGEVSARSEGWVDLLLAIAGRWRDDVEADGGRFYVVLLPRPKEGLAEPLFRDFQVINLWRGFEEAGIEPEAWRFQKDGHWNELGNQDAAILLYERLARDLDLPALDRATLERALGTWYTSFDAGWSPTRFVEPVELDPQRAAALRQRYVPLEQEAR